MNPCLFFSISIIISISSCVGNPNPNADCSEILTPDLIAEIQGYQPKANQIIDAVLNSDYKGRVYTETADLADTFGHRWIGSNALENAIDYLLEKWRVGGMSNVRGEDAPVPIWTRGIEKAEMLMPRVHPIRMLGLGFSVGTPPEGITADVLVVTSFEELTEKAELAVGKIVVYNYEYTSYGESNRYRGYGAREAAKVGAVAALVRSVTPYSLSTPHTGHQVYDESITKIPVACITVEDAELLHRLQNRGEQIVVNLQMGAQNHEPGISRNAIAELQGHEKPEEIVIVSGHLDSWDVGQGVVDDGAASVFSAETILLLKSLDLIPRRTISAVLWTAEESGLHGATAYVEKHRDNLHNIIAAFESDTGSFLPLGIDYAGPAGASCIVREITKLLLPLNATMYREFPIVGSDISLLTAEGVPSLSLNSDLFDDDLYFLYHHSPADTMTALDPDELDRCLAVWAVMAYVVADLSVPLPRGTPSTETPITTAVIGGASTLNYTGFLVIVLILSYIMM